jgi:predicted nucleic acid-binding protein
MMPRGVTDTNLWIRALLGGQMALPILEAWQAGKLTIVVSQPLIDVMS